MPDFDDSPSAEGATNVALHQRAATSPFAREVVNIQGDENPGRAIGFDSVGRLSALSVEESPFTSVDTEAMFDAALASGRSIVLRGEGVGGVIPMTTPKTIPTRWTTIKGPGHLRFTLPVTVSGASHIAGFPDPTAPHPPVPQNTPAQSPRAITILADDVTLSNFELSHTGAVTTNTAYGIVLSEAKNAPGHRLKLLDMHIHDWGRCINKDADYTTAHLPATAAPIHEDILIERCYIHTFNWAGASINYGFRRLVMRDTRIQGYVPGVDSHNCHHNAVAGGGNWYDCVFENCFFGCGGRMGFEAVIPDYTYFQENTRMSNCRVEECSGMGISIMFGRGTVVEKCVVKNVHWIGLEVGGRPPEPGPSYRYGTVIVDGCVIDGVDSWASSGGGQSIGISMDGAEDSVIRGGTKVSNITASLLENGAAGICMSACERCSVQGVTLRNAGYRYIYVSRGPDSPNNRGFHLIEGNACRNTTSDASILAQAVYILDTSVEVRDNTAWQKLGTNLNYVYTVVAPAVVMVDGTMLPPVSQAPPPPGPVSGVPFPTLGSNLILTSV